MKSLTKIAMCSLAVAAFTACQQQQKQPVTLNVYGSANPYMPVWEFIPDGEPYVFEDPDQPGKYRVYVYGSHDDLVTAYCGRDQVVWSAPVENLNDWRFDGTIFELKQDAEGKDIFDGIIGDVLYAPDIAEKIEDGKKVYYFYPNVQGERGNVVCKSDRPDGPFTVCNWDPANPRLAVGPFGFDPAAFVDDDGRAYGYWGFERSYAAELDPNTMATVKEGAQIIEDMIPGRYQDGVERFFEASSIRKIKDKYVFIYSRWTKDGEEGLPETNYTLAYCWSNNPLGPWTYGGTIIDGRGRKKLADGTVIPTACPGGNTHGTICEINGQWYVFYHRQAGTSEYSRQAMVAPITVEVTEGAEGSVKISEGEYTSEGFNLQGLDPFLRYPAGIACYYVGPQPAYQDYPNVVYNGPHTEIHRLNSINDLDGKDAYDVSLNQCPIVDTFSGSTVGYKYFNCDKFQGKKSIIFHLNMTVLTLNSSIDIFVDQPTEEEGGTKLATLDFIQPDLLDQTLDVTTSLNALANYTGKHALYFVFKSEAEGQSIATLHDFYFTAE